jgi:recombinational DNA repair ATPase RecF
VAGGKNLARDQARGCAVARDIREIEREITQVARWAEKWRKLEEEALEVGSAMGDSEPRRQMLFISEGYRLLAERAEERRERLVAHAAAIKRGPC